MTVKSPVLKYYGSKFRLASWIISFFPEHRHYVEPFGGAANVLLQKPRSPLETYNDLNDDVVTFFRVPRDRPKELMRKIRLTPWSRSEFVACLRTNADANEIEVARRLYFRIWMNYNGSQLGVPSNWRRHTLTADGASSAMFGRPFCGPHLGV